MFVIASESEAIHRAAKKAWIASSRSLSSGARSRDPLAPRNDGEESSPLLRRNIPNPGRMRRDIVETV